MNKPLSPAAQAVKDHFLANASISLEHGLAAILRERYGSSATADWLDGVGCRTPGPVQEGS